MESKDMRRRDRYLNSKGKRNQKRVKNENPNLKIWSDTYDYCMRYYRGDVGQCLKISDLPISFESPKETQPLVEVLNVDTLDLAIQHTTHENKVLILNMASDYCPGGGVRSGKLAQEESLFLRTTACMTHDENAYPLRRDEFIFSPSIKIIKDSEYRYLDQFFEVGMISMPAIRKPRLLDGKYLEEDRELMQNKIRTIFRVGIQYKYTHLILGALGCGCFHNPPEEVAKIFKACIQECRSYFEYIGFAILKLQTDNYEIFKEILC